MKKFRRSLVWVRRDLRLRDHRAMAEAANRSQEIAVVFVFDSLILSKLKKDDQRVSFIFDSILEMDQNLRKMGSALLVLFGDPQIEIPKIVKKLSFEALFLNEDYEPSAKVRDEKVKEHLWKNEVEVFLFKDQVIFSGSELKKKDQTPYQVFTPFKNAWLKKIKEADCEPLKVKKRFMTLKDLNPPSLPTLKKIGFKRKEPYRKAGEKGAQRTLRSFLKRVHSYDHVRDFPDLEQTSGLSIHLRFGTISIRECVRSVLKDKKKGARVWLSELIWREFYQMILDQFPYVEKSAFKKKWKDLSWPGKKEHLLAWKKGQTGFPLIDAAMRKFEKTGWMHNRLRMIVASFLVKDLLIDWKEGERYFAQNLFDFDLASNNGGWQWCASTGCDAQPYFRVFHPVTQSRKFDPRGDFIRTWVPELKKFSNQAIHFPLEAKELPEGFLLGVHYPKPIVDHSTQRKKAIALFR